MVYSLDDLRSRYQRLAIPTIQVAFALSIMLHLILLAGWLPKLNLKPFDELMPPGPGSSSLAVRLAPPPGPPPSPVVPPQQAPAVRTPPPSAARPAPVAPQPAPPVLAIERPSPPAARPQAEAPRAPPKDDLAAYIEARRRAREPSPAAQPSQPVPPQETEQQRINREASEKLGLNVTPSFGADKNHSGGIFQIQRLGYDSAEFVFFGWNKFINRNSQQMIEVRKGDNPSIEIAVVRKMISIIREHESRDFIWQSRRLGREVSLSARMSDNAGLEDFMMREFFFDARPPRN